MTRMKLILALAFVLVFAAGGVLGVAVDRSVRRRGPRSRLARTLNLTREQRKRMREIWSRTLKKAREEVGRAGELRQQRRERIHDLLTDAQREEYEAILQEYERGRQERRESRRVLFESARERTRQILNEKQRAKYDELMEKGRMDRGPHRRRRPGRRNESSKGPDDTREGELR